jgi:hypothetical protein
METERERERENERMRERNSNRLKSMIGIALATGIYDRKKDGKERIG